MARPGILYSHVAKAAAQLTAAGKNPTVDTVREALGGTGSKSTITPLLKQWKNENQGETTAAGAGIPVELLEAVKSVYERVQTDAARQIEKARAECLAIAQTAQEQLRQCQDHHDMLSQSATSLAANLEQAKEALVRMQAEHQSEKIAVATLRSDNAGVQQRLTDRAAEVKMLGDQLGHARGQFEHYQESIATQRSEERRAFEQRTVRLEQEIAAAQQRLLAQQSTVAQQEMQLAHLRTDAARCVGEACAAREALAAAIADRVQLTRQLAEASASNDTIAGKLDAAKREAIDARMELSAQQRQTELLTDQLNDVDAERGKLAQEKLTLIQDNAALKERLLGGSTRTR